MVTCRASKRPGMTGDECSVTITQEHEKRSKSPLLCCSACKILSIINNIGEIGGLVHNHPSGDPTPLRADIQMTQAIIKVAKPLGIAVHDHIIVGRDGTRT